MFHYQKDIDAWRRHTRRLSLVEKGAYCELLDELYATEQPLPNDADELYRITGCNKPDERKAVDKVLARFFDLTADGYVQARAFEEISEYQANAEKNRNNGKKGGRPPKNKNPNETHEKPTGLFLGSENTPKNTDFENPNERQSGNPVIRKSNSSPSSVVGNSETDNREAHPLGKFRMPPDWQPNPELITAVCVRSGAPPGVITPAALADFVGYWASEHAVFTESQWIQKLVTSARKFALRNPEVNLDANGNRTPRTAAEHRLDVSAATTDYERATNF